MKPEQFLSKISFEAFAKIKLHKQYYAIVFVQFGHNYFVLTIFGYFPKVKVLMKKIHEVQKVQTDD